MRNPRLAGVLILSALIAGCSAQFSMSPVSPLAEPLSEYRAAYLACESATTEDVAGELADLSGLTLSRIMEMGVFESAQLADAGDQYGAGDLVIRVSILNIKKVGGFKRFMLGAFAGRASMEIDVQFLDGASNRVLGSYLAKGESGGTGMSGGTSIAVMKTAEAIENLIAANFAPRP